MPTVTFAHGIASSPTLFLQALEDMAVSAHLTHASSTRAVLILDNQRFTLTGTDFTWDRVNGTKTLTGGTLDQVVLTQDGARQLTVANLGLDLADLHGAAVAETTALNPAAVETLLYPLGWTFTGNGAQDILAPDATSADGVPINLTGDDLFHLKGGFVEILFLGDGNDSAFGGGSFDSLYGGTGRDILHGDGGADQIFGGNQGDFLFGGGGNDRFYGGSGDDLINGGRGTDTMSGEQGHDTFVFRLGDGVDQIRDFDLARDVIDLPDQPYVFVGSTLIYGPGVDVGEIFGKDQIQLIDINPNDVDLVTIV